MKHAFAAVVGVLGFCLPVVAQQIRSASDADTILREELEETGAVETGAAVTLARGDIFRGVDSAALIHGLPVLTLLDGRRFPISTELGRMGVVDFPVAFLRAVEVQPVGSSPRHGSDGPGGVVNLQTNRLRMGGEVGFFYGRSDGKYDREDYSAFIIGGVGTDRFNITAGMSYHESSGRLPRGSR